MMNLSEFMKHTAFFLFWLSDHMCAELSLRRAVVSITLCFSDLLLSLSQFDTLKFWRTVLLRDVFLRVVYWRVIVQRIVVSRELLKTEHTLRLATALASLLFHIELAPPSYFQFKSWRGENFGKKIFQNFYFIQSHQFSRPELLHDSQRLPGGPLRFRRHFRSRFASR